MGANYNNSAWFYDRLSRIVYGKTLVNAQVYLLKHVPANSRVLIAGGGTGWILEELSNIHPTGLSITYVEIAEHMMALSQKRNIASNKVTFINDAIENVILPVDFDVVITPFLFDNFTEQTLVKVFDHIQPLLKKDGLWLNTDFQLTGKWWQQVLLKTMFLFFKVICGIEASRLPAIGKRFAEAGYKVVDRKTFFGDFIVSEGYTK